MDFCSRSVPLVLVLLASSAGSKYEDGEVIASSVGIVEAGNYTRYTFSEKEFSQLVLTTLEGDADLYVSDVHTNPTFEFEEHVSSSATCGVDTVALPPTMGRPINIAVYGYPRYEKSRYRLEVIYKGEIFDPFDESNDQTEQKRKKRSDKRQKGSDSDDEDDWFGEEDSLTKTVLNVLQQVLLILLEILL